MTKPEVSGHCGQDLELPSYSSSPLTFLTFVSPDINWTDTCLPAWESHFMLLLQHHLCIVPCECCSALRTLLGFSLPGKTHYSGPLPMVPFAGPPKQH